jgi:hypothetical protein
MKPLIENCETITICEDTMEGRIIKARVSKRVRGFVFIVTFNQEKLVYLTHAYANTGQSIRFL